MRSIGVFGGTFDPIHFGHLRPVLEILQRLNLSQVRFVPCGQPPHRVRPTADAATRLAMLQAAIASEPRFVVDERELHREGPSYTVDTLKSMRAEMPDTAICLILGMDAFLGLPGWHEWREILKLAHLAVAHRPGWRLQSEGELGTLLSARKSRNPAELLKAPAGRIYMQAVTQLEISSTHIRECVAHGEEVRYLVPESVRNLIEETGCYRSAVVTRAVD